MKNYIFLIIIFYFFLVACKNDNTDGIFEYHAHIESPANSAVKKINDTLRIVVNFESHTGQTIHHINIQVKNNANSTILLNEPASAHVHETDGLYNFHHDLALTAANGFSPNSTYVLTAKVWGENDGEEEEIETIEFSIE